MPYYETVFIARQDLSTTQVEALTEAFSKAVTDNGGTIAKTESWGLRSLAYKIKKNRKGHYMALTIDAPIPAKDELERQLRINEDLLRYLTIRTDTLDTEPSIMMREKTERSDRGDRPRRSGGDRFDKGAN